MAKAFFDYDNFVFRYEPFPIGAVAPLMDEATYDEFIDNFPSADIFESFQEMGKRGEKLTLSERENPTVYKQFVKSHPLWNEFHRWIKSDDFVYGVMEMLKNHYLDLGFERVDGVNRLVRRTKDLFRGRYNIRDSRLRARFEFSALPSSGGNLPPHTDSPAKVVTIIVSMTKKGEWDQSLGGGTDINVPKDDRHRYNNMNTMASFDDMDILDTYDFQPNQGVLFVKTYDSWHSVRPIRGTDPKMLRKTLTINIEKID